MLNYQRVTDMNCDSLPFFAWNLRFVDLLVADKPIWQIWGWVNSNCTKFGDLYLYIWASYRGLMDWWARISWQFHEYPYWLVVWNMFYFSIYSECHHPTDFHIFQRGRYTTNQLMLLVNSLWSTIKFPWIPIKLPDFHGGAIARRCCWNWNPNWLLKRRPSTTKTAGNFGDAQF